MTNYYTFFVLVVFVALPIASLVMALLEVRRAKRRNQGVASALLPVFIVVAFVLVLAGLFLYIFDRAHESARRSSCLSNVHITGLAMIQYANDYNGLYPAPLLDESEPAQRRLARLLKFDYLNTPRVFHCPSAPVDSRPAPSRLDGPSLTDSSLTSIADVYLAEGWASYGLDPRLTHNAPTSRVILADRPHPDYWGTGVDSPPADRPGSNSLNHRSRGQNASFNDGHIMWLPSCRDDSNLDPNIFASNSELPPDDDSNVDFGTPPAPAP